MVASKYGTSGDPVPYTDIYEDPCEEFGHHCGRCDERHIRDASWMLDRIHKSLRARLEGRNEGGDIEVMRLVDEIVRKEAYLHVHDDLSLHCLCGSCAWEREHPEDTALDSD